MEFNNTIVLWIVIVFMLLGSINFSLYFHMMRSKYHKLNDPELKAFLAIVVISSVLVSCFIWKTPQTPLSGQTLTTPFNFLTALSVGTFQAVSAQTSTGFAAGNFDLWPFSAQATLLLLFFTGGMAGSTAGGIKVIRQLAAFKILTNRIEKIFRPDTVREYRLGSTTIDKETAINVFTFLLVVGFMLVGSTLAFIYNGLDPETALSTASCMLNNTGLAFRMGGPTHSFAFLSLFDKLLSCFLMVAGRLEYFALLVIFLPSFWRRG